MNPRARSPVRGGGYNKFPLKRRYLAPKYLRSNVQGHAIVLYGNMTWLTVKPESCSIVHVSFNAGGLRSLSLS
jgi:hypothetical protein